jgi:hypothetical protein
MQIVGCDCLLNPPGRYDTDLFYQVPKITDPAYRDNILQILSESNASAVTTLIDPEIPLIESISRISGIPSLNGSKQVHGTTYNKLNLFEHCSKHNLPVVPTSTQQDFRPPFIVKDQCGSAASGFRILNSNEDVQFNNNLIFQPLVTGKHYCVDTYFSIYTGEMLEICVKEVLSKDSGESYVIHSVDRSIVLSLVYRIADTLDFRGWVNFDIHEYEGDLCLMDVNNRLGGNAPASVLFGSNLLDLAINEICGEVSNPSFSSYRLNQTILKTFCFNPVN